MPDFLRAVCGNVRLLLEDLSAWLRPALASARSTSADLLQRLADAIAPQSPTPLADADPEFAEMLAGLGAEPPPVGQAADTTLADTTIRSLTHDLHGLRDLGDRLARAEQDKLALAARVRELEAGVGGDAHGEQAAVARLERKLEQREEVLARARERVGRQRAKTDVWKRKAAERWHEIGSLRGRVKQLERALADARDGAQPGPLPGRSVSGSRREPSAARRSDRAN